MKKIIDLSNESGFGLIQVIAVTAIVSVAIIGLFVTIEYARSQAELNYHTRSALLLAQGYLEEIRCNNRNLGTYGRPRVTSETAIHTLDDYSFRNIKGELRVTSTTNGNPFAESGLLNTFRDEVQVEVVWRENKGADPSSPIGEQQQILLQENYYWKRSQVTSNY